MTELEGASDLISSPGSISFYSKETETQNNKLMALERLVFEPRGYSK